MGKYTEQRKTIRLKDYDYSAPGFYFITICTQERANLFGAIHEGILILSQAGIMIERWIHEIPKKFNRIVLSGFVIMPNHIHAILQIPEDDCLEISRDCASLARVLQWFKTMTTNDYIRGVKNNIFEPFDKRIWQRNYYEHIIRSKDELLDIKTYIMNNPKLWKQDTYFD